MFRDITVWSFLQWSVKYGHKQISSNSRQTIVIILYAITSAAAVNIVFWK